MSNFRRFKQISDDKLKSLKEKQLRRRTYAKVKWAVHAYCDWRNEHLKDPLTYDYRIYQSDLSKVEKLNAKSFEYAMCKFIAEVTKQKDGSDYPGHTLYEMCVAIQKHLTHNGLNWKLIKSDQFSELHTVLDNVMKERASDNIGLVKKQESYIPINFELELWKSNALDEDTPDKLRDTVLFLLGLNLGLHAGDKHYDLCRDCIKKPSQLSFKRDSKGIRCLVYTEDSITKTNDGGLKSMKNERKIVWVYPCKETSRCPIRLVEKYISLCPPVTVKKKRWTSI